jgi:hypothetical protein
MKRKIKRIFIGPHEIAGYYKNLSHGFQKLGIKCDYITYGHHPFEYGGETKPPRIITAIRLLYDFRQRSRIPIPLRTASTLIIEILQAFWTVQALCRYDTFIFGFGQSLMPRYNIDLILLKALGKTVISNIGHGSESRPPVMDGSIQSKDGLTQPSTEEVNALTQARKNKVARIERFSTIVIGAPYSTTQFASQKLINWFALGIPFTNENLTTPELTTNSRINPQYENRPIRILHSPSHPAAKGSALIIDCINNLKAKGFQIELTLLHGKKNDEVLSEISLCDFVVDQVYSDTPMAGFATEAAWFGKPAIVGGYALNSLRRFTPEGMWPPTKICTPAELQQAIEELILNPAERSRIGTIAQNFVHTKWNSKDVAQRYLILINREIPDEWWIEPRAVTYFEGCGQPLEQTQLRIHQMLEQFSISSLRLDHRHDLVSVVMDLNKNYNTHGRK